MHSTVCNQCHRGIFETCTAYKGKKRKYSLSSVNFATASCDSLHAGLVYKLEDFAPAQHSSFIQY